jgi:hypothetical protein
MKESYYFEVKLKPEKFEHLEYCLIHIQFVKMLYYHEKQKRSELMDYSNFSN